MPEPVTPQVVMVRIPKNPGLAAVIGYVRANQFNKELMAGKR